MRELRPRLQAIGARVILVVCQRRAAVASYLETRPIPFPVVIDEDRSIAKRWGAYVRFNLESIHIARPATFVVNALGILAYVHIARSQRGSPSWESVLTATLSPAR